MFLLLFFGGVLNNPFRLETSEEAAPWTVAGLSSDALIALVLKFLARLQDEDDSTTFALPSTLEEHEEDGKTDVLARVGAGVDAAGRQDSVLGNEQLGCIFSSWMRVKTLHVLPNQDIKGLKGFQRLPLQTSPLELPWTRPGKATRKLFENFSSGSGKATSLLEALAVAKRGTTVLLKEEDFEEEAETEGTLVELMRNEAQATLKRAGTSSGSAEESGFLAPLEAETEDDNFAAIQPKTFLASSPADAPLTIKPSNTAVGTNTAIGEDSSTVSVGSSNISARKVDAKFIEQQQNDEQSLEEVQKQVDDTDRRIVAMRKVLDREHGELQQVERRVLETQTTGQELQKQLARQKQLVAMLPQAQANIAKLEAICQTNGEKKAELAQQMEIAREPLLKEYAELEGQKSSRKARCRLLIREIKAFRTEMQEITGIIHAKMESMQALEKIQERQLAKLGKKKDSEGGPMTRNMYTSRIMDIIKQVHKQKQDIAKILDDIKGLQKQLNTSSEKLKRTEAVAEEKLYSAASKSKSTSSTKADAYVECYRKFAQVRELFDELILVVSDVGNKENTARDLQNWISQLEARDNSSHLDKVLADLETIRLENGTLQHELRARAA
ncbi:unnamed protein product [Phytophthora fragariaefolia]|uniref:Unnamed protein product n=1 Tax=Phytophthora fragariaefolia TaxID=1490495 RepID=A0A9W6XHS9_9STRA|nr:unnamed protein product [Phytophthora fragariaefolia]